MPAAAAEIPPNPNTPAITAIINKIMVVRNMSYSPFPLIDLLIWLLFNCMNISAQRALTMHKNCTCKIYKIVGAQYIEPGGYN